MPAVSQKLQREMRTMAVHNEDRGIVRVQVSEARFDAASHVADNQVARDASFLIAPEAAAGLDGFGRRQTGMASGRTSVTFMMSLENMKKAGRSLPSAVLPPMPVPSPPPLFDRTSRPHPLAITDLLILAFDLLVVSFVSLVSSMLQMRSGLVILMRSE